MGNLSFVNLKKYYDDPPETQVRNAMIASGVAPPEEIIIDGIFRRYGYKDSCYYIIFPDGVPAGVFGDWRLGTEVSFKAAVNFPITAEMERNSKIRIQEAQQRREKEKELRNMKAAEVVNEIWMTAQSVTEHKYLERKKVGSYGLRLHSDSRLMVPMFNSKGALTSLQYISDAESDNKRFHPNGAVKGSFFQIGEVKKTHREIFVAEGYASAATVYEETEQPCVVAFSASNIPEVVKILREKYPTHGIVVVADNDEHQVGLKAAKKAVEETANVRYVMPETTGQDVNDFRASGGDVATFINRPKEKKFTVEWGNDLPEQYVPPDEIIEGIICSGDVAMIYGDSNSGKTFFSMAMAYSLSEGKPFFGKNVDQGAVIYLATEAPGSIRTRTQALKKYYGVKMENFAIIPDPINLHSDPMATQDIIDTINGQKKKVKLIIADTLARMSSGANENSGEDMGPIMERFSKIADETGACVLIIHHSGKDSTRGSRGWSGLKGHIDAEIEVSDNKEYKTATIMKQRVLGSKYEEINYKLEVIEMGFNKWGTVSSTCVAVLLEGEPPKKTDRKTQEKIKLIKEAWESSGMEILEERPYITRSALVRYLVEYQGQSLKTAEQRSKQKDPQLCGLLIENGIIAPKNDGYIIIEPTLVSVLFVLKNSTRNAEN